MAQEKKTAKHSHAGHRIRLRERYRKNGLSGFQQHEILELLLSFVVARRDTNELAHKLLDKFGSINNVMDTPYEVLKEFNGIGEVVATFLKFVPEFLDMYIKDAGSPKKIIQKGDEVKAILEPMMTTLGHENLAIVMIASNDTYLGCEILSNGKSDYVNINPDKIIGIINRYNAKRVVLAHNHPSGLNTPSVDDISFTKHTFMMLRAIGVDMLDHLIYSRNNPQPFSFNDNQDYNDFRIRCIRTLSNLETSSIRLDKEEGGDEF